MSKKILALVLAIVMVLGTMPVLALFSGAKEIPVNVALGKTATTGREGTAGDKAVDGNTGSYVDISWTSDFEGTQEINPECWVTVDLGEVTDIVKIGIANYQSASRYYHFDVFGSTDNENWTLLCQKRTDEAANQTFYYDVTGSYRYVKEVAVFDSANGGYHFAEIEVYAMQYYADVTYTAGDCTAVFDGDTLTISGTGAMAKPEGGWSDETLKMTKHIVIEDGVTVVAGLDHFKYLEDVVMADSVVELKGDALAYCGTIPYVKLSKNVRTLGQGTVYSTNITTVSCYYDYRYIKNNGSVNANYNDNWTKAEWVDVVEFGELVFVANIYGSGMENWSGETQILICPRLDDNWKDYSVFQTAAYTITMEAGEFSQTVTLKPSSIYDGGSWGIVRFQPCVENDPANRFVPVAGTEYTMTVSVTVDGVVYTATCPDKYSIAADPITHTFHTITWKLDGEVLGTSECIDGGTPTAAFVPELTKEEDGITYNLVMPEITTATGDATYEYSYSTEPTVYTVYAETSNGWKYYATYERSDATAGYTTITEKDGKKAYWLNIDCDSAYNIKNALEGEGYTFEVYADGVQLNYSDMQFLSWADTDCSIHFEMAEGFVPYALGTTLPIELKLYKNGIHIASFVYDSVFAATDLTLNIYGNGFENWSGETQMLVCPRLEDNYADHREAFMAAEWTFTLTDKETGEAKTIKATYSTEYNGGTWGILRFQPCLSSDPANRFEPVKDRHYELRGEVTIDGVTYYGLCGSDYYLDTDPITYTWYNITWVLNGEAEYTEQVAEGKIPTYHGSAERYTEGNYVYVPQAAEAIEAFADATYEVTYVAHDLREVTVGKWGNGYENWAGGTGGEQTQLLLRLFDWEGNEIPALGKANADNYVWTLTINGTTYTAQPSSYYSVSIFRFEPCLWAKQFVPQAGANYRIGVTIYNAADNTVAYTSVSDVAISIAADFEPIVPEPTFVTGDINGDNEVTIEDVTALLNVIAGQDAPENGAPCDLDGDNEVLISDVTQLLNIIAGVTA